MSEQQPGCGNYVLNAGLVLLGLVVMVLLYAFVTNTFLPHKDATREENPGGLVGDILQVEVRNGCGVPGLAARATRYLRRQGFDVVEVGDYGTFEEPQSFVVDRVGDLEAAHKVARSLGIPEENVRQEIRRDLYLDASIVIGLDYGRLKPFEEE